MLHDTCCIRMVERLDDGLQFNSRIIRMVDEAHETV